LMFMKTTGISIVRVGNNFGLLMFMKTTGISIVRVGINFGLLILKFKCLKSTVWDEDLQTQNNVNVSSTNNFRSNNTKRIIEM
jgi:hypothetical protein